VGRVPLQACSSVRVYVLKVLDRGVSMQPLVLLGLIHEFVLLLNRPDFGFIDHIVDLFIRMASGCGAIIRYVPDGFLPPVHSSRCSPQQSVGHILRSDVLHNRHILPLELCNLLLIGLGNIKSQVDLVLVLERSFSFYGFSCVFDAEN